MGKKKKFKELMMLLAHPDIYYIYSDSGDGDRHEYTIKVRSTDSGVIYSMHYSNSPEWSEEQRDVNIFHIINTGNEFKWIDTVPELVLDYADMHMLQVFLRFIQDIESKPQYTTTVVKVDEVSSYNF